VSTIDRIRYYDGEFLRAFDFSDEQAYHLEMRRRLNRYLHLYGIVYGLDLVSPLGSTDVSILPGLAIDAFGREVYVFVPYTLGDVDITANRIPPAGGMYDVWLRYMKAPSTPPSAGYGAGNQPNQYTRWVESFRVVLLQHPSHPFILPDFSDEDTDDPSRDHAGVLLGTVTVSPGSASQFASPNTVHRHFLGVIAQRIQTPLPYDAAQSFKFHTKQSPRNPPVSLEIEPNIFARENLILGPDFDLTQTSGGVQIKPNPNFATGPGSAKLAGDLVVQGNIYSFVPDPTNPQWLGLSAFVNKLVQQNLPDIAWGYQSVISTAGTLTSGNYSGSASVPVSMNRLTSFTSQQVIAYFSQIETAAQPTFNSLFSTGQQVQLRLTLMRQKWSL
jgi:hypothetical protein